MSSFEVELKKTFIDEAMQLLSEAEQCFLSLEENPNNEQILDVIFRIAHNLKGSAKGVGFEHIGDFTHELENLLLKIKSEAVKVNGQIINLLLRSNDYLTLAVESLKADLQAVVVDEALISEVRKFALGSIQENLEQNTSMEEEVLKSEEGFRIFDHDEAATIVLQLNPSISTTNPVSAYEPTTSQVEETIRVNLARLEKLIDSVGEMAILQTVINEQLSDSKSLILRKSIQQLNKVSKEIQDISMSLRMVAVKPIFQKMQRIVRDTAKNLDKSVRITLLGEETELDKTVQEKLSDPLIHLVRNAVDHGIEPV